MKFKRESTGNYVSEDGVVTIVHIDAWEVTINKPSYEGGDSWWAFSFADAKREAETRYEEMKNAGPRVGDGLTSTDRILSKNDREVG